MCNNCIHKPVCDRYKATGGHVSQCEHHKEDRHGRWTLSGADKRGRGGNWRCSSCDKLYPYKCDFCPNCGADMRGEQDG